MLVTNLQANWRASTMPLPPAGDLDARAWNIGTGRGTSVNELADLLMRIAGREVERLSAPERPGEVARSVLECSRARRRSWDGAPKPSSSKGWRRPWSISRGESMIALLLQGDPGGLVVEPSIWNMVRYGSLFGQVILGILLVFSLVSWAIIIQKMIVFRRLKGSAAASSMCSSGARASRRLIRARWRSPTTR